MITGNCNLPGSNLPGSNLLLSSARGSQKGDICRYLNRRFSSLEVDLHACFTTYQQNLLLPHYNYIAQSTRSRFIRKEIQAMKSIVLLSLSFLPSSLSLALHGMSCLLAHLDNNI